MAGSDTTDAVRIPLNHRKYALVDADDLPRVAPHRWYAHHDTRSERWYAVRTERAGTGNDATRQTIWMHRVILDAPTDMLVDHRNNDGLDNRKANLRFCTSGQRGAKRRKSRNNRSGYRGVTQVAQTGRWRATMREDGRTMHLGYFATAEEAARAYDKRARDVAGEYAFQNFPTHEA